ncbi:MAG: Histidine kinase [Bacteroidota bacterium]|jgi:signal transduction histidine kinase
MQIRSKLTIQFAILVTAILLVSYLFIYFFTKRNYEENFYGRLRSKANSTAELLVNIENPDPSKLLRIRDNSNKDLLFKQNIAAYDSCFERIYLANDTIPLYVDVNTVKEVLNKKEIKIQRGDMQILGLSYLTPSGNLILFTGAVDEFSNENIKNLQNILLALFLLFIIIVIGSGYVFAGAALSPISKLINQVNRLSVNKLEERLSATEKKDEIGKMIETINELLNRIEQAFNLQKTFISNVSHELKNPLTKISAQLEVALLSKRETEDYVKTIESVLEDTQELANITESLLELNKIRVNDYIKHFKPLRIDEILLDARSIAMKLDKRYKVSINVDNFPENEELLIVNGNDHLLVTAFKNLIENACKFSNDQKAEIEFKILESEKKIRISIINQGKGIAKGEIKNIFQPFYRSEKTANTKGYGIGLSLVDKIIEIHQGEIHVESIENERTIFSVELGI